MKYLITEEQYKTVDEKLEKEFEVVKNFLERITPKFPDYLLELKIYKPKFSSDVMVFGVFKKQTPNSKIEEVLDRLWERIYNYLDITVQLGHEFSEQEVFS